MCTFITEYNHESKKAKNINKYVLDGELKYEDYKNVLFHRSYIRHEIHNIQSKGHHIGSYRVDKISFFSSYGTSLYFKIANCIIFWHNLQTTLSFKRMLLLLTIINLKIKRLIVKNRYYMKQWMLILCNIHMGYIIPSYAQLSFFMKKSDHDIKLNWRRQWYSYLE